MVTQRSFINSNEEYLLCALSSDTRDVRGFVFTSFERYNEKTEITIVDGKICIDGRIFEHHELREAKQFIRDLNASEALLFFKTFEELKKLYFAWQNQH